MKKNTLILILLAIAIIVVLLVSNNKKEEVVVPNDEEIVVIDDEDASDCGFTLTSPVSGSSVMFPLTVTGIVDNTDAVELGCSWTMFEATAAGLMIKDEDGNTLATSYLGTSEEWMTTGPVNFSGTLTPTSPIPAGTLLTLIVTEEDPSGGEAGPASVIAVPLTAL